MNTDPLSHWKSFFCPRAASLILSQQTWFILSPSDQRQGFSVTSLACPPNSQPPAGRKQACRRERERELRLLTKQFICRHTVTYSVCAHNAGSASTEPFSQEQSKKKWGNDIHKFLLVCSKMLVIPLILKNHFGRINTGMLQTS